MNTININYIIKLNRFKTILLFSVYNCFCTIAYSQWNNNTMENNPICNIIGYDQVDVQLTKDNSGGSIMTWVDFRNGQSDIYAQRIDYNGNFVWTENGIPICTAVNSQIQPKIVNTSSGAIITWVDNRNGNFDIYAQMISFSGIIQLTPNGIPICNAPNMQNKPNIISDLNGGALICWTDRRNNTSNDDIYIQRLDFNGNILWNSNGVVVGTNCIESFSSSKPEIVTDGTAGGAIITWSQFDGVSYDIYAQRIISNGNQIWNSNGIPICSSENIQLNPKIALTNVGGAIIAWEDNRNGNGMNIYAQKINASGIPQWNTNGIPICTADSFQGYIDIVDYSGGAIITWEDERDFNKNIYSQKIDNNGNAIWLVNGITVCDATNNQFEPNLLILNNNDILIVWSDNRFGLNDIYAQSISQSGNIQWSINGVTITNAPGNQYGISITSDNNSGAIITWQDDRNGTFDIYSSKLLSSGILTISELSKIKPQIYPTITNNYITIDYLSNCTYASVSVLDILGKKINQVNDCTSQVNISYLNNGIYFLKVEIENNIYLHKFIKK